MRSHPTDMISQEEETSLPQPMSPLNFPTAPVPALMPAHPPPPLPSTGPFALSEDEEATDGHEHTSDNPEDNGVD